MLFFLQKKWRLTIIYALSFIITLSSIVYALLINNAQVYKHEQIFYFLVSKNQRLEASSFEIKAENGAGYLLEKDGKQYIALSVYFNEIDGENALQSAITRFDDLAVVSIISGDLYFITPFQKRTADRTIGGLKSFLGGIRALESEIKRLEKGATQQSSKRILNDVSQTIAYLGEENELFKSASVITTSTVQEIIEDVVYLKDLRYLLWALCMEYTSICSKFSL